MRTTRSMLFVLGSIAALAAAGCSSADSGGTPEPSTSTVQVTASSAAPTATSSQQTSSAVPTSEDTTSEEPTPTTSTQQAINDGQSPLPRGTEVYPGVQVKIGNDTATVCVNGDGWGMNVFAVGANTSCEFASAVSDGMTEGLNPTYDNVRDHLPRTFTATSPVTQQSYEMTCTSENYELISCRGGNNAVVYFY